ncbi:unnamed protein product [Rotaria sp. Silwood2]|nr:unnamed protein product [Rotaria sp. Silwood2]CAF2790926.1 unnamed protein product [Rotaria sp. Silwood2]CAF3220549.1 unnamed protein product [Rotaria sp. Silwood2]CAF4214230.1 unnamed protein product [Rotaria sp. Silwood2]CAF4412019.1 unnamed protein product [Rotaria sp. Silwood2]
MANIRRKGDRTESVIPPSTARSTTTVIAFDTSKKPTNAVFKPWTLTQLWIESISKEASTRKEWEHMYGWMADYDSKIPNSRGHDYGWQLQNQLGKEIEHLQTCYNNQHKKRVRTEVLGYD